jgi:hypothetical protein
MITNNTLTAKSIEEDSSLVLRYYVCIEGNLKLCHDMFWDFTE